MSGRADAVTHRSRTAQTCDILRTAIVEAAFLPGERLRIEHLCKAYDVSSGAVREALSRLTAEGLVVAEPQKGFVVAPVSRRDLVDLTEVRIAIETGCLTASIAEGDVDWEARILASQHRLNALPPPGRAPDSDRARDWHGRHGRFHQDLVSASPNGCWRQLRELLYVRSERYRRLSGPADEGARSIQAEHDEIVEATLARDAPAACAAMTRHLARTTEILLKSSLPFLEDTKA